MKISDTDLDVRDREWAEHALGQDEELLLALKPIAKLKIGTLAFLALLTVLSAAGFIGMLCEGHSRFIPYILASFTLFCSGVWNMTATLLERRALRRGIYLVTTRRLLYLAVSAWRREKREETYEIRPGAKICADDVKPDGSGDLRIEYETEEETLEHGALLEEIPQAQRVADALRTQVASLPPGSHRETAAAVEEAHGKPRKKPVAMAALIILGILALSFGGIALVGLGSIAVSFACLVCSISNRRW